MTERNDQLVADYLSQVSRATAGLPRARRDELIRDLHEHIEAGRAELPGETEAQVRDILERLGDPEVIARAAAEDADPIGEPGSIVAGLPGTTDARPRRSALLVTAIVVVIIVVLAVCAGLMFFARNGEEGAAMMLL